MTSMESRPLGQSGISLGTLGFGGGPVGWRSTPEVESEADALLDAAWQGGIRFFDTAPYYGFGKSERRIGRCLAAQKRSDFVLSTKVGRLIRPEAATGPRKEPILYDYSRDGVLRSIDESLGRLGLDRIDIVLVHDIDGWTHGADQPARLRQALDGAGPALIDLKAQGVIRAIGLGVNEWQVCVDFVRALPVDCVLLAGRHSLLQQEAARQFVPFCKDRGIGLIIGGPYNSGILASGPTDGALYDYAPAGPEILAKVRQITEICARHDVPLGAAALAFVLRAPPVASVIPGVATVAEMDATFANFRTPIPVALWAELADRGFIEKIREAGLQ